MRATHRRLTPFLLVAALLGALLPATQAASAAQGGGDAALARSSLRKDLTRERFYFVMPDRFANGSRANDRGGLVGGPLETGFDPTHKGFYHGGDLEGLIGRLDYIKRLGTTAIWFTPAFKNRPVQGAAPFTSAGYHGYWITDFTRIDPHLGTNQDLERLVDGAHARGMKVFFDIITNHTADVIDYAERRYDYRDKLAYPYRDAAGNPFDDRAYANSPRFPELDLDSFPYTPVFNSAADATVKVPAWLNDRTMYHNRGNSTFQGESSEYGDFFGLDDLFTERPEVLRGMEQIYTTWIEQAGVDGFRIDTAKHVNIEFWQRFSPDVLRAARAAGKPRFFMFGEVFDADPAFTSTYTTKARLQAVLDFGFQANARAFASGSAPTFQLRDFFAKDDLYTDRDSNVYSLPTFLGNHDMGRIGNFLRADNPGAGDAELLARDRLAHALMYFSRGQPVVYYGDEQGFTGDGGDQDARQDMFPSRVASYNDDDLIGTDETTADDNFDRDHPLYRTMAALSRVTARHPALRDGAQIQRLAGEEAGVFAFSRIDARRQVEYVVALNNAETARNASIPTYSAGMRFHRVWPAGAETRTSGADRALELTVPPLSAVVYKAAAPLARSTAAPAVALRAPADGGLVGGRTLLDAAVAGSGFNQVTFAVRVGRGGRWTPLGTDDNPAYRVFYDTSGLPSGTRLAFKAVVLDNAGHVRGSNVVRVRVR